MEASVASGRTYRTDGSLIRETDPDYHTDGKAYRADGTVKHPGDADYVTLPNYRSDGSEVKRGTRTTTRWKAHRSPVAGELRQYVVAGEVPAAK